MAKCLRCGKSIYPESPKICFCCGKDQSEGPDISDNSPNYEEKYLLKQMISYYDLISILEDDVNQFNADIQHYDDVIQETKYAECPIPAPTVPSRWEPAKQPYPPAISKLQFKYKPEWGSFTRISFMNPIISIVICLFGAILFIFGTLYNLSGLNNLNERIVSLSLALSVLLLLFGGIYLTIVVICIHTDGVEKQKAKFQQLYKADIDRIYKSAEYKAACDEIDRIYESRCKQAEVEYQESLKRYNDEKLPKYEIEKAPWEAKRKNKLEILAESKAKAIQNYDKYTKILNEASANLESLHDSCKLIPYDYRDHDTLRSLYDIMDSTTYDVKDAIQLYNQEIGNRIQRNILVEKQRQTDAVEYTAMQAEMQSQMMYEMGDMLDEQTEIMRKARRDNNIGHIINIKQHHDIKKLLK